MKRVPILAAVLLYSSLASSAQPDFSSYPHEIGYFLPKTILLGTEDIQVKDTFDRTVPTPKEILGFELGERYCDWNDVLKYMEAVDAASDRICIKELGRTYEARRLIQTVITSPENHSIIDSLKTEHLKLTDAAQSSSLDIAKMPLVADITCSIHGNEASGVNAAIAMTYFFAASEDESICKMLDDLILLIVPGMNPDGINRFATWCNTTSGDIKTADPASREYREPWPSSRLNHYWADCNRDMLMCQHPEGRTAVRQYLDWMPNIVIDLHEKGGKKGTFFHSPGDINRRHPYITLENHNLTAEIGAYVTKALEPLGARPYCGSGYDDFYLGKGAAYGDIHGSVGLLYENPNIRNHINTAYDSGPLTFPMSVRNQTFASIAALCAGYDIREKLLRYQQDFYVKSASEAEKSKVQGYIFHTQGDRARAYRLLENLTAHDIEVYRPAKDIKVGKTTFSAEESFIIPLRQRFFYKIKGVWETLAPENYEDNHFYDVSTWTFPLAYNVTQAELKSVDGLTGPRAELSFPEGRIIGGKSDKAYIIGTEGLYSCNLLRKALENGLDVKVATRPFRTENGIMASGSAVIETEGQPLSPEEIHSLIEAAAKENGADAYAVGSKFDIEKLSLTDLRMPKVAMIIGSGMSSSASGEKWWLLDRHFGLPLTRILASDFGDKDLSRYNVILASGGTLSGKSRLSKLKQWVENGGTLIVSGSADEMVNRAGLAKIERLPEPEKGDANKIRGIIVNVTIDPDSPLGYGYMTSELPLFKRGVAAYDETKTAADLVPMRYTAKPNLSGYISETNIDRLANTPAASVIRYGQGQVIHFSDNLTFRSYWYGATKLFMNAIYFGYLL